MLVAAGSYGSLGLGSTNISLNIWLADNYGLPSQPVSINNGHSFSPNWRYSLKYWRINDHSPTLHSSNRVKEWKRLMFGDFVLSGYYVSTITSTKWNKAVDRVKNPCSSRACCSARTLLIDGWIEVEPVWNDRTESYLRRLTGGEK